MEQHLISVNDGFKNCNTVENQDISDSRITAEMPLIETRFGFSGGGKGNPAIFHPLLPKTEAPALWKYLSIQSLAAYENDQIQFFIYIAFWVKKIPYSKSFCGLKVCRLKTPHIGVISDNSLKTMLKCLVRGSWILEW